MTNQLRDSLVLIGFGYEEERSLIGLLGNGVLMKYNQILWLVTAAHILNEESGDYPYKIINPQPEKTKSMILNRPYLDKYGRFYEEENLALVPLQKLKKNYTFDPEPVELFSWQPPGYQPLKSHAYQSYARNLDAIKTASAFNPTATDTFIQKSLQLEEVKEELTSSENLNLKNALLFDANDEIANTTALIGGVILSATEKQDYRPMAIITGGVTPEPVQFNGNSINKNLVMGHQLANIFAR